MKKANLCILLFILIPSFGISQQVLTGNVSDSTSGKLQNAVVSILNSKDSTLVTFTRTDKDGKFSIKNITSGNFIYLITYPAYGDYVENVTIGEGENVDLKNIYLTQKAKLLEEIVIRQAAIRIKGDTTEYNADSFQVAPNASVEDLLKELPGIQVDKDGKITAQGQKVQKILVDGDEFFSDDPTVATKNLRADAIDKVQVFDKKSDQAAFTGIDDGETTKTLNLKLKANAKNGYFGKVSVAGLDKYYNATAMINAFKDKRKIAAFGIGSTTDQTGLGWDDSRSYGFNDNSSISFDAGIVMITSSSSSGDYGMGSGNSYGQGLPKSLKGGVHFSDKWNNEKINFGGNYLFNNLELTSQGNTLSKNVLPNSFYYSRNERNSLSDRLQNSMRITTDIMLDSSSTLKISGGGYIENNHSNSNDSSWTKNENYDFLNSSKTKNSSKGDNESFNVNILWQKKFKKVGRTISINFSEKYNLSNSDNLLLNNTHFYDAEGQIFSDEIIDQNKLNKTRSNVLSTKLSYTEPLSKKSFIELNYGYSNNKNEQSRLTFNKNQGGKYADMVDSLSSDFQYLYNTHTGGANFRYNEKKYNFSFGGSVSNTSNEQNNLFTDSIRKYNYLNFFPQATLSYKFNSYKNLRFNYSGGTTQPTIDQLQPLKNNSNPLNIQIGNPNLKQQFRNSFNLSYNSFQVLNNIYMFASVNYSTVQNQISNSTITDKEGRTVSQYINVNGNNNISFYSGFGMKIPKTEININANPYINFSRNTSFVNSIKNESRSFSVAPEIQISTMKKDKYRVSVFANPSFTNTSSSITPTPTKYWEYAYGGDGTVYLPKKFELGSEIRFEIRDKITPDDNNNKVTLWNAYVEKKFLKNDVMSLRFSMRDILNQNKGYSRNLSGNGGITERNYLTFSRYGLITLTYNFTNKGAPPRPKNEFF